ncbi:MAG: hypothetical protein MZU91_05695 [Desulfosudis oleivorans]|nr:hypothetical protein [Desulfosudis oleivorans]
MTNIADNPDLCEFIIPATIQQGDLTIAISTNGKSPALAKKIRIELENKLRSNYAEFLNLMGEIRETAIEEIQDNNKREEFSSPN